MTAATELVMPKLGLTMTEGRVARWAVAPGDAFEKGQCIVEIETDKIVNEVEAPADGLMIEHVVPAGATVDVAAVIARWRLATSGGPAASSSAEPRVVATPYARKLAREAGLSLHRLAGSGPNGRIKAADVTRATAGAPAAAPKAEAAAPTPLVVAPSSDLLQPKAAPGATATHAVSFAIADIDAGRLIEIEQRLSAKDDAPRLGRNHLLAVAALRALEHIAPDRPGFVLGAARGDEIASFEAPAGLAGSAVIRRLAAAHERTAPGDLLIMTHASTARLIVPELPTGWPLALTLGSARDVARSATTGVAWGHEMNLALAYDARRLPHAVALALLDRIKFALDDPLHLLAS